MNRRFSRRTCIATVPAAVGAAFMGSTSAVFASWSETQEQRSFLPGFPSQDPLVVREVVGVSHGNFARVQELVDDRPELAKVAWDWGFGDWESALGAAAHTGRRNIAEYLIENGARPDIFAAAMLGHLEVVKAAVRSTPGIQTQLGPHGITLMSHARAGAAPAAAVVEYLEQLGEADIGYADQPFEGKEISSLVGTYSFGQGSEDRFEVDIHDRFGLRIGRVLGSSRKLFHLGGMEFHPVGALSARFRFLFEGDYCGELEFRNPDLILSARRIVGGPA